LAALLQRLRVETSLSILVFTGFNMPEIERVPETEAILASIDVLIAGRYQAELRLARDLRGSSNKTVYFLTKRYTPQDLEKVPHTEAIITPQGEILITGIDGAADA
jgi:anaerobic ribonucleoside-triphosphate reductase activating protein